MHRLIALLFALLVAACSSPEPEIAPDKTTSLGVAAQPLKDTAGWVHVAYGTAPDHWYEGDAVLVDAGGEAEIIYRRMDPTFGVVTASASGVPCWVSPHPVAITGGPHGTGFLFEQDARRNLIGVIDGNPAAPLLGLLLPDGDGGVEVRSVPNGDLMPATWVWPMWLPFPVYPVPDDVAAIMATACHVP